MDPAQAYGNTAVGADTADIKRQKKNMAAASGKGLRKEASATISIEWTHGPKAQPEIRAHMGHMEAWLRYADRHGEAKKEQIHRAWTKTVTRIKKKEHKERASHRKCDLQCRHA